MEVRENFDGSITVINPTQDFKIVCKEIYGREMVRLTRIEYNIIKSYISDMFKNFN